MIDKQNALDFIFIRIQELMYTRDAWETVVQELLEYDSDSLMFAVDKRDTISAKINVLKSAQKILLEE